MNATPLSHRFGQLVLLLLALAPAWFAAPAAAREDAFASDERYSRPELARLVAPVALYPDALLAQILMAATYPIEVIEADRWLRANPGRYGAALDERLLDQPWDPSVKALCHFPALLALMSERIGETSDLGYAFLAQPEELMAMVQELRYEAYARGTLTTTPEQRVVFHERVIVILPADQRVIYLPSYDPLYVYGPWRYPAHRPRFWGPPELRPGLHVTFRIGTRFAFGDWCSVDWRRHSIRIDLQQRPRFVRPERWVGTPPHWRHAPAHRHGLSYRGRPERGERHHEVSRHERRPPISQAPQHSVSDRRDPRLDSPRSNREAGTKLRGPVRTAPDPIPAAPRPHQPGPTLRERNEPGTPQQVKIRQPARNVTADRNLAPRQPEQRVRQDRPDADRERPTQVRTPERRQAPVTSGVQSDRPRNPKWARPDSERRGAPSAPVAAQRPAKAFAKPSKETARGVVSRGTDDPKAQQGQGPRRHKDRESRNGKRWEKQVAEEDGRRRGAWGEGLR